MLIVTSLLVTPCMAIFMDSFKMGYIPANKLSTDYKEFTTIENTATLLKTTYNSVGDKSLLLFEKNDDEFLGVYGVNNNYIPNIIEGRGFTNQDFTYNTNTILISIDLMNNVIKKDGKKMYLYNDVLFEVIGIYKRDYNVINQDAKAYFNLSSEAYLGKVLEKQNKSVLFQLDAYKNTKEVMKSLKKEISLQERDTIMKTSFGNNIQKVVSTYSISIIIIILLIGILILNIINIITNWIDRRKSEIYIRTIVGATNKDVLILLLMDFLILHTISSLISSIILIIIFNQLSNIPYTLSLISLYSSFLIITLIGSLIVLIITKTYRK